MSEQIDGLCCTRSPALATDRYQPRYRWREAWPGEGHKDYTAWDGGICFGRIQLDLTTHTKKGQWMWNITHIPWAKQRIMPNSGWAPSAREASRMVEEQFDELKRLNNQ